MFAITLTEKGGDQRRLDFDKAEITIGRVQGNDVVLPKGNVSKRHARIVLKDGKFIIVDLKSTNGTYVNGRKITSPLVVKGSDKIYIGDFILGVEESARPASAAAPEPSAPPPAAAPPQPAPQAPPPAAAPPQPAPPQPAPPQPAPPQAAPPQPARAPMPSAPPPLADPGGPRPGTMPPPAPQPVARPPAPAPRPSQPPPPAAAPSAPSPLPPPAAQAAPQPAPMPAPEPVAPPASSAPAAKPRLVGAGAARSQGAAVSRPSASRAPVVSLDANTRKLLDLQDTILEQLVPQLGLDSLALDRLGDEELWQRAESSIIDMVETMQSSGEIPAGVDQDLLTANTLNEALGLGPLEDLLADDTVSEIVVDRVDRILVSKGGGLTGAGSAFSSEDVLRRVIERLAFPTGKVINDANPFIDVRLRDGTRLAAALPPVAARGACLTLRKPSSSGEDLRSLVAKQTMSEAMSTFLQTCIEARKNIIVCGAPSSGKGVVLGALASAAPAGERIVSVEEVTKLQLARDHWIALESRPGDGNGLSNIDVDTLLRGALRMRPDRLVVGDVRGGEAYELVQAMASMCDGTLASITGEGAIGGLNRLVSMATLAGDGSPQAMRQVVASAVDVVVYVARYADGVTRIATIDEVTGATDTGFATQTIFAYGGGAFAPTGAVPGFYADLQARGVAADQGIFQA
jgi:pilus assembly protein CpaF